jgi:hypothetical protein
MPTEDYVAGSELSKDKTARCSGDTLLRNFGYRIVARPEGKEAVWEKNGIRFKQSEALMRVNKEVRSVETTTSNKKPK